VGADRAGRTGRRRTETRRGWYGHGRLATLGPVVTTRPGAVEDLGLGALTWLPGSARNIGDGERAWTTKPTDDALDPTLCKGTSGIALTLLEGRRHFRDDRWGDAAVRGARSIPPLPERTRPAHFHGPATIRKPSADFAPLMKRGRG
jgi:hypothetical protein